MIFRINDPFGPQPDPDDPPFLYSEFDGTIMFDDDAEATGYCAEAAWRVDIDTPSQLVAILNEASGHIHGAALQITRDWTGHRDYVIDAGQASI